MENDSGHAEMLGFRQIYNGKWQKANGGFAMMTIRKIDGIIWVVLICTAVVMGAGLFVHRLETGGDNLDFLLIARSIHEGDWHSVVQWHHPMGYPLLMATLLGMRGAWLDTGGLFHLTPEMILWLKGAGILLFAATAVFVYLLAELLLKSRKKALIAGLLFATNQTLAAWSSVLCAETYLTLLLVASLYLWEKHAQQTPKEGGSPYLWGMLPLFALTIIAKHQGLILCAAYGVWVLCLRWKYWREWVAGGILFLAFALAVGCILQGRAFPLLHFVESDPYRAGTEITWLFRLESAACVYSTGWADLLIPKVFGYYGLLDIAGLDVLILPGSVLVFLVLLAGFAGSLREGVRPSHVFFACFYVMLFAWPDFLPRYLFPVFPLGLLYFLRGLFEIGGVLRRWCGRWVRHAWWLLYGLVAWSVAVNAFAGIKNWRNIVALRDKPAWAAERYRIFREDDFADYMEVCEWAKLHLETNAVLFARKGTFAELASERPSCYYSSWNTPEDLWAAMALATENGPVYLLKDNFDPSSTYGRMREQLVTPLLRDHEAELPIVTSFPSGVEFRRVGTE